MNNNISVISLGCPKNLVDSNHLIRRLTEAGFSYRHAPENANIILINTCGFIEDAKKESIEAILNLAKLKKGSSKKMIFTPGHSHPATTAPYPKLIVFGCLAKRYKNELIKEIPEIDAIYGIGEEDRIIEYCKSIDARKRIRTEVQKRNNIKTSGLPNFYASYAYLKIAEGCSQRCTYCIIPSIRGDYKSIAPDSIIKEAERFIKAGIKELIVVAQDTACYGKDLKGKDIASLLKALCSINGDFWIRLLYAYPSSINESLLEVIAKEEKICKYLDIPFQHSEDRILKLMKRNGTKREYLNLIKNIRRHIPDIVLRTTLIVGFPSETEGEFNSLLDFIDEAQFDRLGVFKYSKEEGTPAARLKGHLTDAVKSRRFDKIMHYQSLISLEKNKRLIGSQFRAVIDELNNGIAIARLYSHAPEIDGVVILESSEFRNNNLKDSSPADCHSLPMKAGDFIAVKITDAYEHDLKGIMIA